MIINELHGTVAPYSLSGADIQTSFCDSSYESVGDDVPIMFNIKPQYREEHFISTTQKTNAHNVENEKVINNLKNSVNRSE